MEKIVSVINIKSKILNLRNKQVIIDKDLADFYKIDTKRLKIS